RRLGAEQTLNSMPALSGDGRKVAYVAFEHSPNAILGPGRLWVQDVDGGQASLIKDDASYYWPTWSPDQTRLAVVRRSADGKDVQLGWIDLKTKSFRAVAAVDHY